MIKNSKELKFSKEHLEGFKRALASLRREKDKMSPYEFEADENASLGLIEETEREIRDYENLISGDTRSINLEHISDLGKALIQARIAQDLTQEELGDKLGIEQQQIYRYEAGDYETIKWARMIDIIEALDLHIKCDVKLKKSVIRFKKPDGVTEENIEQFENSLSENRFYGKAI